MPRRLIAMFLLTWLCGCTWFVNSENNNAIVLAPPLDPPRRIVQHVKAEISGRQQSYLCIIELDKRRLAVAGLTEQGLSLFNVSYDGAQLKMEKSPLLPKEVRPEHVIQDLQRAFWPLPELKKVLPDTWRVNGTTLQRQFFVNDNLRVSIVYSRDVLKNARTWPNSAVLTNHRYQYRLHIETVSYEVLP